MFKELTLSNWIVLLVCLVLTGVVSAATVNNPMTEDLDADEYDILDVGKLTTDDIITKGPWVDVDAYGSFSAAISGIGANEKTLLISSVKDVNDNETVPSNITLYFLHGGKLDISEGNSVTVNGQIEAGLYRIFAGGGTVSFGEDFNNYYKDSGNGATTVYPQWWGAKGDGDANDTAALQNAFNSIGDGQKIVIPPGTYHFNDTLHLDADYSILECEGILVWTGPNIPAVLISDDDVDIDDGTLWNVDVSLDLIDREGLWATDGIGVLIEGVVESKITIKRCWGFRTGLQLGGENGGASINTFYLGDMRHNRICIDVNCTNGHWCNGNKFYDGHFAYFSGTSENFNDTVYVNIPYPTPGDDDSNLHSANNNTFYSCGFECPNDSYEHRPEYFVYCDGTSNAFIHCRNEGIASIKNVFFDSNSECNLWMGGASCMFDKITDNGSLNKIESRGGIKTGGWLSIGKNADANEPDYHNTLVIADGYPHIVQKAVREWGGAAFGTSFVIERTNSPPSTVNAGEIGLYGYLGDEDVNDPNPNVETHYIYMGAGEDANYQNAALKIDPDGEVGIGLSGKTPPARTLEVVGKDASGSTGADATDVLYVTGGRGGACQDPGGKGSDILLTSGIGGGAYGDGGNGGDITLTTGAGSECEVGTGGDGGDIELTTGEGGDSVEGGDGDYGNIILAKNGGNVGIGTTSPSKLLDVNGDADVGGTLTMDKLILPVKTTTGDPASPVAGQIYVNTYDNKVRVYADGAWRDLATW